ncbi:MAG: saccharopine dehydrogenase NADP-binding domain-containing protein [Chitinophagaceae bacterium]|nr:saccharopine dehydrogenase NADP-binding domain-containing protein [Chitinophagaceae bacterium]
MKKIVLFGAGKSATVLIEYLIKEAAYENWKLIVADADLTVAQKKVGTSSFAEAISFDARSDERQKYVQWADIVISLLPPPLHILVAQDCITYKKNLLTASYVDDEIKKVASEIQKKGLLFLYEMGLDPGIDHMSAKKIVDEIVSDGGTISSFISHCGGLVAPESDDNPWHYKISWNPRNIVTAGKAGALFKQVDEIKRLSYKELFSEKRFIEIPEHEILCWYPNRDSLNYMHLYGLDDCSTFIRTTLRHPDFIYGWRNMIELKLTDEEPVYETDGKTLMDFFKEHMHKHNFGEWLEEKLKTQFEYTKTMLNDLLKLVELEEKAEIKNESVDHFMMVNQEGGLQDINVDELKTTAAATIADKMHEANLTLKQLFFLGMDDGETLINKGKCSAADVLQFALEKKLALQTEDRDMVVMLHEIESENEGKRFRHSSYLSLKGKDAEHTAMAKTVGLPLGIAAKLILNGTIAQTGLHIPVIKEIYEPVLDELKQHGVEFKERIELLP